MKKYLEILKKCPLFEGVDEQSLPRMLTCLGARVMAFDKKYTILAEGSPASYVGIMLTGRAQVVQLDYYGNRSILAEVTAAEMFAEAFACAEVGEIPVSVIADEPCEVMLIDCKHILHTCTNNCGFHQQLIFNLMKDLAVKTLTFHRRIEITSKRTTRDKLMAYLMMLAKQKGSDHVDVPFDRQELADYLEVDRSGLSAEIGKMKKEGLIDCQKQHFVLL